MKIENNISQSFLKMTPIIGSSHKDASVNRVAQSALKTQATKANPLTAKRVAKYVAIGIGVTVAVAAIGYAIFHCSPALAPVFSAGILLHLGHALLPLLGSLGVMALCMLLPYLINNYLIKDDQNSEREKDRIACAEATREVAFGSKQPLLRV